MQNYKLTNNKTFKFFNVLKKWYLECRSDIKSFLACKNRLYVV